MQIVKTLRFQEELEVILDFIAQSTKSNDVNVRDLIFDGYVIPYRINKMKDRLEIIGIFSANEWGL